MTLGEAIEHVGDKISNDDFHCKEWIKEHLDLLEWLEELRDSRILNNLRN